MRSRFFALGLCFAGSFFNPMILSAQPSSHAITPSPDVPRIVPPHLAMQPNVPYPAQAKGDASVLLRLTINADGSVRDAQVTEGAEPFASAACKRQ